MWPNCFSIGKCEGCATCAGQGSLNPCGWITSHTSSLPQGEQCIHEGCSWNFPCRSLLAQLGTLSIGNSLTTFFSAAAPAFFLTFEILGEAAGTEFCLPKHQINCQTEWVKVVTDGNPTYHSPIAKMHRENCPIIRIPAPVQTQMLLLPPLLPFLTSTDILAP